MKTHIVMVWFLAGQLGVAARDEPGAPLLPKEPVCGFMNNPYYFEETQVKQGLAVDLVIEKAEINRPVTMKLFVSRKPGDFAVNDLQIEHEKFIHVIGVRDDLGEFFHIHPKNLGPGIWEVTHTFTNGGSYKIWTDVRCRDASYAFGQPLVAVAGNLGARAKTPDRPDYEVRSGFQITFKHTEPLINSKTCSLEFLIRDAQGRETETEDFLGAPMHLVIIREDLSVYLHAHPNPRVRSDPTISFSQLFPKPGRYKLFAQFRPKGTKLEPDDAIVAEFYVEVKPGGNHGGQAVKRASDGR